jgi:predicted DNA-binding protein YlxM (UPF0122 family)
LFWLKQFYHFNSDLLREFKFLEDFEESLKMLEQGKWREKEGCSELQGQIMEAISNQNETKVVTKCVYSYS